MPFEEGQTRRPATASRGFLVECSSDLPPIDPNNNMHPFQTKIPIMDEGEEAQRNHRHATDHCAHSFSSNADDTLRHLVLISLLVEVMQNEQRDAIK